ncbi:MAG: hypothetical protein WCP91_03040 [Candidatus Berkelbacteria bacterium]
MPKLGREIGKPKKTPLWQIIMAWCQTTLTNLWPSRSDSAANVDGNKTAGLFHRPKGIKSTGVKVIWAIGILLAIVILAGLAYLCYGYIAGMHAAGNSTVLQ